MGNTAPNNLNRRCIPRYSIAVPIDVIALRSGVPATIPGRTVNVSEKGVATILAGELSPGETVGIQFQLPLSREPIQAKAVVRHYSLMQCGLQFLAMPVEQQNLLRTWTRIAGVIAPEPANRGIREAPTLSQHKDSKPSARSHNLRWVLMSAAVVVVVLAAVAWWSWNTGWRELEKGGNVASRVPALPVEVSSSVMAQRIIHRVDPIYPREAVNAKIQGEVTLEVLIGEDGTMRNVSAVAGPELLRPAAVDAVRWWRFEPYRLNGQPAPVHTLIEVDFRLDR